MGADLFGSLAESTCAALVVATSSPILVSDGPYMMFLLVVSAFGIPGWSDQPIGVATSAKSLRRRTSSSVEAAVDHLHHHCVRNIVNAAKPHCHPFILAPLFCWAFATVSCRRTPSRSTPLRTSPGGRSFVRCIWSVGWSDHRFHHRVLHSLPLVQVRSHQVLTFAFSHI